MIIGIAKILILFPFIPYMIFIVTSRSRKKAHLYNGPIMLLSIGVILNYLFSLLPMLIVIVAYLAAVFYFATDKTKRKRTPKKFGLNILYFMSWIGLRLYLVLIILGIILEFFK